MYSHQRTCFLVLFVSFVSAVSCWFDHPVGVYIYVGGFVSFGASILLLLLCVHASDYLVFLPYFFLFLIIVRIIKSCTWIIFIVSLSDP